MVAILWLMINENVYHIILENIFRDWLLRGTGMIDYNVKSAYVLREMEFWQIRMVKNTGLAHAFQKMKWKRIKRNYGVFRGLREQNYIFAWNIKAFLKVYFLKACGIYHDFRLNICFEALVAGNQDAIKAISKAVRMTRIKSVNCGFTGK